MAHSVLYRDAGGDADISLTLWLLAGQNIGPFPKEFQALSTGFVPDVFEIDKPKMTALLLVTLSAMAIGLIGWRARTRDAAFGTLPEPMTVFALRNLVVTAALISAGYKLASFRGLPNVVNILTVLTVLFAFFTENITTGRRIYAHGGQ